MAFYRAHVLVCAGTNCSLKASKAVRENLVAHLKRLDLEREVKVVETGCFGLCEQGPTVVVYPEGVVYCRVGVADVSEVVEKHLLKGRVVQRLLYREPAIPKQVQTYPEFDYFKRQVRVVLRNCGVIDPDSIEEYIAHGGYQALARALSDMRPEEVVEAVEKSGLRGRGGAGFPTGRKWRFTRQAQGFPKYVVCNADEGEPGTFKDRLILEGDPHSIVEAMAIAGYAVGANKGYIYIRGEYGLSIQRLDRAIRAAREYGFLGDHILGSDFSFDLGVGGMDGQERLGDGGLAAAGFPHQPELLAFVQVE